MKKDWKIGEVGITDNGQYFRVVKFDSRYMKGCVNCIFYNIKNCTEFVTCNDIRFEEITEYEYKMLLPTINSERIKHGIEPPVGTFDCEILKFEKRIPKRRKHTKRPRAKYLVSRSNVQEYREAFNVVTMLRHNNCLSATTIRRLQRKYKDSIIRNITKIQ